MSGAVVRKISGTDEIEVVEEGEPIKESESLDLIESENLKKLLTEAYETDPHVIDDPSTMTLEEWICMQTLVAVRLEASRPDVYRMVNLEAFLSARGSLA